MRIDELIEKLQQLKSEHGNLPVRVGYGHEYWGTLWDDLDDHRIEVNDHTTSNPKRADHVKAVVFNSGYDI